MIDNIIEIIEEYKPTKKTLVTILWGIVTAAIYFFSKYKGIELSISETDIIELVNWIAAGYTGFRAFWYNNSFTNEAKQADEYLDELRSE